MSVYEPGNNLALKIGIVIAVVIVVVTIIQLVTGSKLASREYVVSRQ